ncbi:MAG TPA: hypothetical protein VJK54_07295 [Chthoniobacterales bacterium]|nr:hypothetical protein [Chthoniobacterales bacterium]
MKKLIYFLTILFSTHYLLAQNDNRLKAINQVTGDRLQVVGSNQKTACTEQDNNRLKETEKQTTDNREAELASGNQIEHRVVPTTNHELRTTNCGNSAGSLNYHLIGQGAKFTTNDERRTTNCDNQDVNLDCYLMMNPEEINKAEEAFGFTRMDVLPYRSTTLSTIEGSMSTEGETSISAVISEQEDVIENNAKSTEDGNMVSYKFLEEDFINVEEKILELKNQIEEIEHVRLREYISEQSYCRDCIIAKLEQSIDSWKRFNELLSQGNEERASQWKKVAEESEVAAKSVRNLVMNCLYLRQSEDGQFRKGGWNSYYLSDLSTWELKSKEAFERANEDQDEKKDFWRDLATQYQEAAEYERKASEMHNLRRENEENAYARIGRCLYSIANRKFKAMRARELGKNELIVRCQEAGETFRKAAEQWKLSVEKQIEGKEDESNILGEIGKFLQEKGDCQVKAIETKKTDSWTARIYLGDIERLQKIVEILQ